MKMKFKDMAQEDVSSLVVDIMDLILDQVEIPDDKIEEFENQFCEDLASLVSKFFDDPDYRNYN